MNARRSVSTILIGLSAFGAGGASAQTVYRCADNSYSQQPCDGGRPVRTDDPRTPQQQLDSLSATRREAALADEMEQTRLQRQAHAERALAAAQRPVAAPGAAPATDTSKQRAKPTHRREVFVASVPGAKQKAKDRVKDNSKNKAKGKAGKRQE